MLILSSLTVLAIGLGLFYAFKERHAITATDDQSPPGPRSAALGTSLVAVLVATSMLLGGGISDAAIVPTITMGTADDYSVLAGTTVTNTGATVLEQSLGVSPGTAVTGFPPGVVTPPATIELNTGAAVQAQMDLTAAYDEAATRPLNATIPAELGGQTLVGGVYAAPAQAALSITGNLILDGEGDPNSVFIFQTATTLGTAAASTITLINGAQECNVFWQVGSSATLGASSTFVGSILALTAITVGAGVTVRGRALARNAAVTLDSDTFAAPTCELTAPTTTTIPTTTTTIPTTTTTTAPTTTTTTTIPTTTTTTLPTTTTTTTTTIPDTTTTVLEVAPTTLDATTTTQSEGATSTDGSGGATGSNEGSGGTAGSSEGSGGAVASTVAAGLPDTGSESMPAVVVAILALVAGVAMVRTGHTTSE